MIRCRTSSLEIYFGQSSWSCCLKISINLPIPPPCSTKSTSRIDDQKVAWTFCGTLFETSYCSAYSAKSGTENNDLTMASIRDWLLNWRVRINPWVNVECVDMTDRVVSVLAKALDVDTLFSLLLISLLEINGHHFEGIQSDLCLLSILLSAEYAGKGNLRSGIRVSRSSPRELKPRSGLLIYHCNLITRSPCFRHYFSASFTSS